MKRTTIGRFRRMLVGTGFLGVVLLLTSCGVTEPDTEGWQDVREFSWPTEVGTTMTFKKSRTGASISDETVVITIGEPDATELKDNVTEFGTLSYVLEDPTVSFQNRVNFLPTSDLLIARKDDFGGTPALLLKAPLEKGHRWFTSSDSTWEAEIVNLYAWRKIEGQTYENVVAVRYRETDPGNPNFVAEQEYIRFYAKGIGEVMTIRNTFGTSSSSSQLVPQQDFKRVLISTQPAS